MVYEVQKLTDESTNNYALRSESGSLIFFDYSVRSHSRHFVLHKQGGGTSASIPLGDINSVEDMNETLLEGEEPAPIN